ncbi:MAG: hypothetical protein KAR36_05725, partial [Candidatus Latescibacteria bacterium]|nr:hypothetical protein [Candidatus Latescibacterota bacterium]
MRLHGFRTIPKVRAFTHLLSLRTNSILLLPTALHIGEDFFVVGVFCAVPPVIGRGFFFFSTFLHGKEKAGRPEDG